MTAHEEPLTAKIPADVNKPDVIAFGFTVRQIIILAATGAIATGIYLAAREYLPVLVVSTVLLPIIALGAASALGRRDGLSLDLFGLAAVLHAARRKRLVAAPNGAPNPPRWCRVKGSTPAPLRLPVTRIRDDGVLELAEGGVAVMVEAATISFALRTHGEQAALAGAFGRWLNSLEAPVQVLVRARPVDLSELADQVEGAASGLPHPALDQAARAHATFLDRLQANRDLLTRQVLIVLRDRPTGRPSRDASAAVVLRRAEETQAALSALGITARPLARDATLAVLAECLDPGAWHPNPAQADDVVTGKAA